MRSMGSKEADAAPANCSMKRLESGWWAAERSEALKSEREMGGREGFAAEWGEGGVDEAAGESA